MFLFFACEKNNVKSPSFYSFNINELDEKKYVNNCKFKIYKNLEFYINHENKNINLKNYILIIRINSNIAYKGVYKNMIKLDNYCLCNDDNLSRIYSIEVNAIDIKNKKVYIWSNKNTYYLIDYEKVWIELNSDEAISNYKIKLEK